MSGNYPQGGPYPQYPGGGQPQGQPQGQGGYPGPGYGPSGPQSGQPGQPGQPPQGGSPYGPYPGGPGGPTGPGGPGAPKKSGPSKPLIIVGAVVLVLIILGVAGGVALVNRGQSADPSTDPGTTEAPATKKASDAVQAYLNALAAGNADQALALSSETPSDKTFLSAAMLQESAKKGAITDINVPEVNEEYAYQVAASYKIGDQAINEEFSVKKSGSDWKVSDAWIEMNLSYARNRTLPMLINGTEVKTDKVLLFPGTYAFTTGNKWVDYGTKSTIVASGPSDYPSASDIQPTLTEAGYTEVVKQGKAKLSSCLKQKKLAPSGCPNQIKARSNQKVDESSISWAVKDDPWSNLKLRLDYDDPSKVRTSLFLSFTFKAKGTQDGQKVTFNDTYVSSALDYINADLSGDEVTFSFSN